MNTILPEQGPVSGGTRVTIGGQHLDAGSKVKVMFGQYECDVQK